MWLVCVMMSGAGAGADPPFATYDDPAGDMVLRRVDPGGDGPLDPQSHRPIDLRRITIGRWAPVDEDEEEEWFDGQFDCDGRFLRMDLLLGGLVNPPGETDPDNFNPFRYGDHPVYGFIEIDVDADVDTGGELDAPQFRYLGNAVRFGGKPDRPDFADRVAVGGFAFDGDFLTPPFVERHGEEFHLALLSRSVGHDIEVVEGDSDEIFEEGETWIIEGEAFHRAHGFERFSILEVFEAEAVLRFRHDPAEDVTQVSLILPLMDEPGAGDLCAGDLYPTLCEQQHEETILSGLCDLVQSAQFIQQNPTGLPEEEIILGWADKQAVDFLDPVQWTLTALLGTSYTQPDPTGEYFAWTDLYPDVIRGDADGNGDIGAADRALIEQYIDEYDADDGVVDQRVVINDFSIDFTVCDVNHDGLVDATDILLVSVPGDTDDDHDVDLIDFSRLQSCLAGSNAPYRWPACALSDFDADGDVDVEDFVRFDRAARVGCDD